MNGDVFESFVERVLVHELHEGDVVIVDNLSGHKRARTREQPRRSMQRVLDEVMPSDAANCYRHCGHTLRMESSPP